MTNREIVEELTEKLCEDLPLLKVLRCLNTLQESDLKRLFDPLQKLLADR